MKNYGFAGIDFGINRNIVECKERLRKIGYYGNIVLIETLWNVKISYQHYRLESHSVLIETLWNVKYNTVPPCPEFVFCINRNIVECKGRKQKEKSRMKIVLIETLWNVKRK